MIEHWASKYGREYREAINAREKWASAEAYVMYTIGSIGTWDSKESERLLDAGRDWIRSVEKVARRVYE